MSMNSMTLDIPKQCPECGKRQFQVVDSENKESFVDLDKGVFVPEATLIRKIKCMNCDRFEKNDYQKPGGKKF